MPIRCSYHRTMHSSVGIPSIGASIRSVCPSSLRAYCVIISYPCSDLCVYLMSRIWIKLWCIPWVARMWSSMGNVGTAFSVLLLLFNVFSYYSTSHTHCEQCQHHVGVHTLQWQSSFHYFWGFICLRGCGIQIASGKPHTHAHVDTTTHTHTFVYDIWAKHAYFLWPQMHKDKETPPLLAFPWFGAQFLSHSFLALERDSRFTQITRWIMILKSFELLAINLSD